MWVLLILVVLCLGYVKSTSTPAGQAILKRSSGWEAYAHLGMNGIAVLLQGAFIAIVFIILATLLATLLGYPLFWFDIIKQPPYKHVIHLLTLNTYKNIKAYEIFIVFFAYVEAVHKPKKEKENGNWIKELKRHDAILHLTLEAAETMTPLRVSLKSRKVYIGIVESEQFERVDLDNLVLIPYLSGYRDKDSLKMNIDFNYHEVYKKNGILDAESINELSMFRVVIRLSEVESISLFNIQQDVDVTPTHEQHHGTQQ